MSYNFFIIGGDLRIFYLAKKLKRKGHNVRVYGFNKIQAKEFENEHIEIAKSLKDVGNNDILISSVPITMDGENIYAPYTDEKISLENLAFHNVIAGKITKDVINSIYKNHIKYVEIKENEKEDEVQVKVKNKIFKFYDVLKDEATTILNTIPTAEGAIARTIEETKFDLESANVLVTGFGNVGKTLAYKLKKLGANVYVEARKERDLAWAKVYGYNPIHLNKLKENICKMDVIFNTVPHLIIDKTTLVLMHKDVLIIDLASKPGGVDFDTAKKMGINAYIYSGIPGKIAPETAAEFIEEYISKCDIS